MKHLDMSELIQAYMKKSANSNDRSTTSKKRKNDSLRGPKTAMSVPTFLTSNQTMIVRAKSRKYTLGLNKKELCLKEKNAVYSFSFKSQQFSINGKKKDPEDLENFGGILINILDDLDKNRVKETIRETRSVKR